MLNPDAKLNPKLFNPTVSRVPTRDGFGKGLLAAAEENPNVVGLCADLLESTRMAAFAEKFPNRFFETGVAEQNLATVAAGLGISGKIPFIASYAVFSPGRNWEQIRTTIAYNNSNVKIIGSHAGVSTGPDGATHQATEDIALMRVLPNMKVFVPCDALEAEKAAAAAAKIWGPCYLRLARAATPLITTAKTPFIPGKAQIFWKGKKPRAAVVACGPVVFNALKAARDLRKEKIEVLVINCPSIKPLDEELLLKAAEECQAVVTVEEHQIAGGLGGAVAELLAKRKPTPMRFVGLKDTYGESGSPEELLKKYGIGVDNIKKVAKKLAHRQNI